MQFLIKLLGDINNNRHFAGADVSMMLWTFFGGVYE